MDSFSSLCRQARTCRRFRNSEHIPLSRLEELVSAALMSPCARNAQILRFALVADHETASEIGTMAILGGALRPEQRPGPSLMPPAFILIAAPCDGGPFVGFDAGIAAQSINLAATEQGLACCMIAAFRKKDVADLVALPSQFEPVLLLAIGVPAEERRIVGRRPDGSLTYYRDELDVHCVPKMSAEEAVVIRI